MVERGNATVKLYAENFWTYTTLATNKRAIYRYELNATIGGIYNYPNQSGKDYKYNKTAHVQDEL
jgi:hypothetical protein